MVELLAVLRAYNRPVEIRVIELTLGGRSLIKRRKNSGPNAVSWGTPLSTHLLSGAFLDNTSSTITCQE